MEKQFGVLVVGAGWVSGQHLAAYAGNPRAAVVAICDCFPEKARQRAREAQLSDVAIYEDVEKAVAHPGVDMVSICTPQHLHCRHVLTAAEAGKHMVIEKPARHQPGGIAARCEMRCAARGSKQW